LDVQNIRGDINLDVKSKCGRRTHKHTQCNSQNTTLLKRGVARLPPNR
jgi:hypothetical protein